MPDPVTLPTFDTLEAIPEAFRPAYEQKDGKFVPKVVDASEIVGLKGKNTELIGTNNKLKARAALVGDRTPEEIQADFDLAAQVRQDKNKAEGNFEQMKAQLVGQHTKDVEKLQGRSKKLESKLYDVMARREAEAAITAAGGNPKVLLPHILPFIKPVESDDDITVKVVDAKGNVRIADAQGAEMTIAQLVETFKADETFGVAFAASSANGSGARNDGGNKGGAGSAVVLTNEQAKDVATYRAAKERAAKAGVPFRVAG